jgi:hypothetical protein
MPQKKQSKPSKGSGQINPNGLANMMQLTGSQFGGVNPLAGGNLSSFNATKKNFPQLNKLTTHKKSYISPYSIKSIQKP